MIDFDKWNDFYDKKLTKQDFEEWSFLYKDFSIHYHQASLRAWNASMYQCMKIVQDNENLNENDKKLLIQNMYDIRGKI